MAMATESHLTSFDLAPSYIDCGGSSTRYLQGIWNEFDSSSEQNTGISPNLLTHTLSEQSEQSTQCSTLSSTELSWNCAPESPMVGKQLGDDTLWPTLWPDGFQWQQGLSLEHRATQQQDMGLHGTGGQMVADQIEAKDDTPQAVVDFQPRKRGRPRLYSNMSQSKVSATRRSHLEKNRIAATKCRERSKQHTVELVAEASKLSSKNKALKADETALREEILKLKNEVLRHAGCGSWAIDGYVSQCAGDILGMKAPSVHTPVSRRDSTQTQHLDGSKKLTDSFACDTVSESPVGQGSIDPSIESDDYENLRLFNTYWDMERQQNWDLQHLQQKYHTSDIHKGV
jgi:hypothetical protein